MQADHGKKIPIDMKESAQNVSEILRGLANPDRLLLLCEISRGESCVADLEVAVGIHQPSLSQQLGVIRRLGLVSTRKVGKQVFYRIEDERLLLLLNTLYELYCR
ncbi:helix-turn-helix transcriptional regulator [Escherichia coli]|uniref:ArsR/SmtB family transcription factor n=1 Tax=Escherichia coli TaxID=562 RepID=UPI000BE45739|nr:metalloregulator ArsR/SmtB family transcription factor [Escherichia coli]EEW5993266.1 transcriptional regulator [Escherichia coli]EEZ0776976.1 helix-turn-helix transcriptional regulator [Escherichia coli]EEZ6581986.1 helix-turn-helix transcriptional regulator [Escherichia coli]EFA4753051.1 transcriptional regulator [Escherichia coli]EFC6587295.1 helix-turn-helix transcriptional regulator [Escherichia coli]